jgi:hypothetical protein
MSIGGAEGAAVVDDDDDDVVVVDASLPSSMVLFINDPAGVFVVPPLDPCSATGRCNAASAV